MEDYFTWIIIGIYVIFLGFIIYSSWTTEHECRYKPTNNPNIYVCTCGNVLEMKESKDE